MIGLLYSADDPTQVGPLLSGVQLLTVSYGTLAVNLSLCCGFLHRIKSL